MRRPSFTVIAFAVTLITSVASTACDQGPPATSAAKEPVAAAVKPPVSALRLGQPIAPALGDVALGDVARDPSSYQSKPFVTHGTVSAVCQEMGCWMELKDEAGAAHIRMAGHAFFVPKNASGRRARVQATLAPSGSKLSECSDQSACTKEAEARMGRELAKLQLVATGVELE
jgi:hypothetical protein